MTELADIFRRHGPEYLQKFADRMPRNHLKAMRDIVNCRTETLGGQVYRCATCGGEQYSYHSCRNRHCPKCQNEHTARWLETQSQRLLPVPYFLVTFTLPEALRALTRSNQRVVYNILLKAAADTLMALARDPRLLGGNIGFMSVLHTWTRQLMYHPHIHCVVPGGALSPDGNQWLKTRGRRWFLPVRALSKMFRGKFKRGLNKAGLLDQTPRSVWWKPWVLHAEPVGSGQQVLKYLAPYVFRTVISNKRIIKLESGKVTFRYKDPYTHLWKPQTLGVEEFIRRFLQHVLPKGFRKIRYYGFLAQACREPMQRVRTLTGADSINIYNEKAVDASAYASDPEMRCPHCGGTMCGAGRIPPCKRGPPLETILRKRRTSA